MWYQETHKSFFFQWLPSFMDGNRSVFALSYFGQKLNKGKMGFLLATKVLDVVV